MIRDDDVQKIAEYIINAEMAKSDYSLSVINLTDDEIKELNSQYRGIDQATDVLTFVADDSEDDYVDQSQTKELGDIFISIDTIQRQCVEWQNTPKKEYLFMLIHGLLHICGWEHEESFNDHEEMFIKQQYYYDILCKSIILE